MRWGVVMAAVVVEMVAVVVLLAKAAEVTASVVGLYTPSHV